MKIEITRDPLAEDLESGLPMDQRHLVLPPGEFIIWLNRILGRKDLFLYYHRETRNFMLAQWIRRDPPICNEIDSWDAPPDWIHDQIEGEHFWKLRLRSTDEVMQEFKQQIAARKYEERAAKGESQDSREDVARWLRKTGKEDVARSILMGESPHISKREARLSGIDGMFDDLKAERRIQVDVP